PDPPGDQECGGRDALARDDGAKRARRQSRSTVPISAMRRSSTVARTWSVAGGGADARTRAQGGVARWNGSLALRAHRILGEARGPHPSARGELALVSWPPRPALPLARARGRVR